MEAGLIYVLIAINCQIMINLPVVNAKIIDNQIIYR